MRRHDEQEIDGALRRALDADRATLPQPLWPLIRDRLPRAARRASPRVRFAFALGAVTAAIAGLVLGARLGTVVGAGGESPQTTWSEIGSVLAEGSAATLGDVYLAVATDDESQETK